MYTTKTTISTNDNRSQHINQVIATQQLHNSITPVNAPTTALHVNRDSVFFGSF